MVTLTLPSDRLAYRVEEVAALLGLSRSYTQRLIQGGEIPSIQIGRSRRVLRSALDAYLADRTGDSPSAA